MSMKKIMETLGENYFNVTGHYTSVYSACQALYQKLVPGDIIRNTSQYIPSYITMHS